MVAVRLHLHTSVHSSIHMRYTVTSCSTFTPFIDKEYYTIAIHEHRAIIGELIDIAGRSFLHVDDIIVTPCTDRKYYIRTLSDNRGIDRSPLMQNTVPHAMHSIHT